MPANREAAKALDDYAVDAENGEGAKHVDGDAVRDEVAVDDELAHTPKPRASTPSKASRVVRNPETRRRQ